jgi:hypothetical protein
MRKKTREQLKTLANWWDFSGNVSVETNMEWKFDKIARQGNIWQ